MTFTVNSVHIIILSFLCILNVCSGSVWNDQKCSNYKDTYWHENFTFVIYVYIVEVVIWSKLHFQLLYTALNSGFCFSGYFFSSLIGNCRLRHHTFLFYVRNPCSLNCQLCDFRCFVITHFSIFIVFIINIKLKPIIFWTAREGFLSSSSQS